MGNIYCCRKQRSIKPVHPHVCGEHYFQSLQNIEKCGSSPRVWGTLLIKHLNNNVSRFIPTCVGNMSHIFKTFTHRTVHPHVCGEHYFSRYLHVTPHGSSPRVWGTFLPNRQFKASERFIPTCVGNILFIKKLNPEFSVHPHVCGEHCSSLGATSSQNGSSPRVWGT